MSISPHPKPVLSVEEWESKAPLFDPQIRSVNWLKHACEERRLPLKARQFNAEESLSRPTTPVPRVGFPLSQQARNLALPSPPSRPSTPTTPQHASHHFLHPKHPVQTAEQFHDWFALVERSVVHSQEAHFRAHLESVSEHRATCEGLLQSVDEVETEVEGMLNEWRGVEEGGRSLKDACERLLEERDRLIETNDAISLRLEYFQELEHATRMLNHPGESLVLQIDFLLMVERVDVCLEYLEAHRHFREAEIYLLRFQQCLTRAMTLIRMYFVGSLKALTADIQKRLSEKDVSETAQTHLLYSKFVTASFQVAPLLAELERRATAHPDDLATLLTECQTTYLAARKNLLVGRLVEEIRGLDPAKSELVELTRAGCSYLKQLCVDEFGLYQRFFGTGEDRLYHYLEGLCDYLYDDLRPRILHEPRLTTLCEVCTVLQALMVLDIQPSISSASALGDDAGGGSMSPSNSSRKGLGQFHIQPILQLVLQDAQTRLLFKAQAVIQSDIRFYAPKDDDLAYPDKLIDAAKYKANGLELTEKESESQHRLFPVPSIHKQITWYPTLRKTLWVLSQLHDFINPAIFDDIAQETIGLCRQSLNSASQVLATKHSPGSYVDGQLFLVRHLLILKDMVGNLDLQDRGTPIPGVTDTLGSMLRGTSSFFNSNGLLASFALSRDQSEVNAKTGIDHDLKRACEELISQCVAAVAQPTQTFVEQCTTFLASRDISLPSDESTPSFSLPDQEFATAAKVATVDKDFRASCEKEVFSWLQRLKIYLEDDKTVLVLVAPLQTKVVEIYSTFRDLVAREYPREVADSLLSPLDFWNSLNKLYNETNIPR